MLCTSRRSVSTPSPCPSSVPPSTAPRRRPDCLPPTAGGSPRSQSLARLTAHTDEEFFNAFCSWQSLGLSYCSTLRHELPRHPGHRRTRRSLWAMWHPVVAFVLDAQRQPRRALLLGRPPRAATAQYSTCCERAPSLFLLWRPPSSPASPSCIPAIRDPCDPGLTSRACGFPAAPLTEKCSPDARDWAQAPPN